MNMLNRSESIADLTAALALAQGAIRGATKDSTNPHYDSRYADLQSVWDAIREPLSSNGLAVIQLPGRDEQGLFVETILSHSSGQWIGGKLTINPVKDDPQGVGSAITYGRRYALAAIAGVAPKDDDGEGAMDRKPDDKPKSEPEHPPITPEKFSGWRDKRVHMRCNSEGKKLGQLDAETLKALKVHWADHLDMDKAHQIDKLLKAAVYEGYAELFPETASKPFPADLIATLRQKCEAAVITEETFLEYAKNSGLIEANCVSFEDVNIGDEDLERFAKTFDDLIKQWGFANPEPKKRTKT